MARRADIARMNAPWPDPAPRPEDATRPEDTPAAPAAPEPLVAVICLVAGGRRRAGRHWPGGETVLPAGALTEGDVALIQADPLFTLSLRGA